MIIHLIALLVFLGHCHFGECGLMAHYLNGEGAYERLDMSIDYSAVQYSALTSAVDLSKPDSVAIVRAFFTHSNMFSKVENGVFDSSEIVAFLRERAEKEDAAIILIQVSGKNAMLRFINETRKLKFTCSRHFRLTRKRAWPLTEITLPLNHAFYLDSNLNMNSHSLLAFDAGLESVLAEVAEKTMLSNIPIETIANIDAELQLVKVLVFNGFGDVLMNVEEIHVQAYMEQMCLKYNAFIIVFHAAPEALPAFVSYLNSLGRYAASPMEFEAFPLNSSNLIE